VGLTRARKRLYLTHAAQRATWGRAGFSIPSRFLLEIPEALMHGPRLVMRDEADDDQRPWDERMGGYDLSAVIGRRPSDYRLVGGRPIGPTGGRRLPPGGGYTPPPGGRTPPPGGRTPPPGAPPPGQTFRPSRDLAARREAYYGRAAADPSVPVDPPAGSDDAPSSAWVTPPGMAVPGQRRFHDGQKVRHRVFGEGHVVSSKLTRSDEEVTVAFPGQGVKKLMASLAGLEIEASSRPAAGGVQP
jgi:DNA helicase-2/ATP-dependent DNA helicase PcrA